MRSTVESIRLIEWKSFSDDKGTLIPIEALADVGMPIQRAFFVFGTPEGMIRGQHGHYDTTQVLTCVQGKISVRCFDGYSEKVFTLDNPRIALKIPPGIWAEQVYEVENSVLFVLCDTLYDPKDYIWKKESVRDLRK